MIRQSITTMSLLALIAIHWWLARRADRKAAETAEQTTPFWPNQAMINAVACLDAIVSYSRAYHIYAAAYNVNAPS